MVVGVSSFLEREGVIFTALTVALTCVYDCGQCAGIVCTKRLDASGLCKKVGITQPPFLKIVANEPWLVRGTRID